MKKISKLSIVITAILLICFDIVSLLLRKQFNNNFWVGFIFVQVAFIVYVLITVFSNENNNGQRGIKPMNFIGLSNIVVMIIMAIVLFAIPTVDKIVILIVPYIILIGLFMIAFAFAVYNRNIIKYEDEPKPLIFGQQGVNQTLQKAKEMIENEQIKEQIDKIINRIDDLILDEKNPLTASLREYVVFIYENARRGQTDNILYNIKNANEVIEKLINQR